MSTSVTSLLWVVVGAGGGGGAVAYGLFRALGTRWLDSKFDERLQGLKHQHDRQMEDVRLEASRVLDRSVRLSEREFEATAEAWSLVYETYVATASAMPGFRLGVPDFSVLSDEMARRVLESGKYEEWEIEGLLSLTQRDRQSYYMERREAHEIGRAKQAIREATNYLAKKALFLEHDVHARLSAFIDDAWNAVWDWELVRDMRRHGPLPDNMERRDEDFRQNAEKRIKALEQFVRERFWDRHPAEKEVL